MIDWLERMTSFREVAHPGRINTNLIVRGHWIWWEKGWHRVEDNLQGSVITNGGRSLKLDGRIPGEGEFRHLVPSPFKTQLIWLFVSIILSGAVSAVIARYIAGH